MTEELLAQLNGVNGQLEVFSSKVVIKRKGILSIMTQGLFQGERTIFLKKISSIRYKDPSWITNGFIQFTIEGNLEYKKGLSAQTKDENTVMFNAKNKEQALKVKEVVENIIANN